jgi:hypothetical protein
MFTSIINTLLDKAQTQDFWRGIIYVIAAAGVTIDPTMAAQIIAGAMAISGVIHVIWHKQHPELPANGKN